MKKNAKILVLILSLTLVIGMAVGFAVSANTEGPEILAKNVVYGGVLNFQFAIDATDLGADKEITVNIYDADPAEGNANLLDSAVAEYNADVTRTNLGVQSAYIATSDAAISAIAYGQVFWAAAECDEVEGDAVKYSAVEYFLERLYEDADTISDLQKEHYENAIAYGSTAQKVVGDTKTNVADYLYIMAKDGTVNGANSAVVVKGDALNFTYTGAEDVSGLAYWLDPAGAKTATATSSGLYTPRFADFTFNDLSTAATLTPSTKASTGLKSVTVADGDKDVSKYSGLLYGNIGKIDDGRDYTFSVTEDGRLKYASSPKGGTAIGIVNSKNYESDHNYSVFEADIQLDLGKNSAGTQLTSNTCTVDLMEGSSTTMYRFVLMYIASEGNLEIYFQRNTAYAGVSYKDSSHIKTPVAEAGAVSVSYKLQIENYYISDTKDTVCIIKINDKPVYMCDTRAQTYEGDYPTKDSDVAPYLNSDGVYVLPFGHYTSSTTDDTPRSATTFKGITINPNSNNVCDIYFDNIIYEATVVETVPTFNIARP